MCLLFFMLLSFTAYFLLNFWSTRAPEAERGSQLTEMFADPAVDHPANWLALFRESRNKIAVSEDQSPSSSLNS